MNRQSATKFLRQLLDENSLNDWHIRLNINPGANYYGLCDHRDKAILLNAQYIDTAPEPIVINTIKHEVAHAIVGPGEGHNDVWKSKAKEIGCNDTSPCNSFQINETVLDAIRSGADVKIEFEQEIITKPKYTIHRLQQKCPICGKVAKIKARTEFGSTIILTYECNHIEIRDIPPSSPFHEMVFDGKSDCKHRFDKYDECELCQAHKLHPYQIEGARFLERANGRAALFDDMGVGKTIQALAYIKYNKDSIPYLWVTKSKVKYQHMKEIIRLLGIEYIPQIIGGSKTHFVKNPNLKGYIISYDLFRRLDLAKLAELGIQTIVLDECQAIKNPDSARTQALRDVVKNIPKILPLSGTPWKNRGSELFVVLNMLDPKMFWSYKAFKDRYIRYYVDSSTGEEKEGGFKNPEQFREQISHIAIRRELREVLPELPPINRQKLYCEVPEHARLVYNDKVKEIQKVLRDAAIDGTEDTAKVQQTVDANIIVMRQIIGLAKVPTVVEWIEEFLDDTDRKLVVFVHHIKVGELIYEQIKSYCAENDYPLPIRMLGGTNAEDTGRIQDEFNDGAPRILVASTLSAGEGLNLQKNCYDALIVERQWNPANEEQPERRLLRHGQKSSTVNVRYALGDKTIDMTVFDKMVEQKRFEFESSMNKAGYANEWNPVNLRKELINAILSEVA